MQHCFQMFLLTKSRCFKLEWVKGHGNNILQTYLCNIVTENAELKDVIFEMTSKRLGTTSVVDEGGKLKGVITDGDLRRLLERTMDINGLTAKDVMSKNPKVMQADYLASFALQRMENYHITTLIIIDEKNNPTGIVHLHDLIKLGLQNR